MRILRPKGEERMKTKTSVTECRMNYEGFEEYDPTVFGGSSGKGCFCIFIFMILFFILAVVFECSS